jgi:hypothetical protein
VESSGSVFTFFQKFGSPQNHFSLTNLGICYEFGIGVLNNDDEAFRCFFDAKDKNSEALRKVGCFYQSGKAVEKNEKFAAEMYRKSAELGNALAQYNLGTCYRYGTGVASDAL